MSCAKLRIGCNYSRVKPEWMDGSEKQAEMTRTIKARIRQGTAAVDDKDFAVQVFPLRETLSSQRQPEESKTATGSDGSTPGLDPSTTNETDDFLMSLYLDTVFPCLFPWYQPQTLAGGRSWLLTILKTQQAAFHAAISLSAYYFTRLLARDAQHILGTPCEQELWDAWTSHMDLSMKLIRQDLSDINVGCRQADIFHSTRVLDGIVHLLIFEASIAKTGDWNLHLTAALSQLDSIFQVHGVKDGKYHLHSLLLNMQLPSIFNGTKLGHHIWSADQTSFQFSTAILIYADIIASFCLREAPRLRHCHNALIAGSGGTPATQAEQLIHIEHYFGCYGWAFILIGDISSLDAWKLATVLYGGGGLDELVAREKELEMRLYQGLANLGTVPESCKLPGKPNQSDQYVLVTKLWLHAGLIYLSNVVRGWHPTHPAIRTNIHAALKIVKVLTSNFGLRCPMWPLCVAGCMATDDEELEVRHIMTELPPIQSFGANKEVLNIMEGAWHRRGQFEDDHWNLADHFRDHGPSILLI
jgi:hypothetical protein